MTQRRGLSLGSALTGAFITLLILGAIGAAILFTGRFPVAASTKDGSAFRWVLMEAREHGVQRSAEGLAAPNFTPADIREGASHFKGMCQSCHGGPGAEPEEFAGGMNPHPPNLARATGDLSVEQVFWIAKNGLRMTGMPAFGKTDDDEELWKVAAFVKQMSKMSPSEYASLPNAHEEEGHEAAGGHHDH